MMKGFLFAASYLLCLSEVNVKATPSIWMEPEDVREIIEPGSVNGVDVFLQCFVNNLNAAYKVSWKKNGIVISDDLILRQNLDYLVDTARYHIIQKTVGKQYALEISHITETTFQKDNGQYQCIVFDVNNNQDATQSRIATVVIYDTVACLVNDTFYLNSQFVSAGSITKVICRTYSLSNPQVSVQLFKQGNDLSSLLTLQQNGHFLDALYVWIPSKVENGITITCVSSHSTFPSTKSCTIGPFTVHYKPDVTITPTSYTITSTLDSQVLTCNADANPSVQADEFVWKYDGVSIQQSDRFIYVNNQRNLLIRNMLPADNGMHTLTCEATNVIGTGFRNVLVTTDIHEHTSTTSTQAIETAFHSPGSKSTFDDDGNDIIITAGGVGIVIGIVLTLTIEVPLIMFAKWYKRKLNTGQEATKNSLGKELYCINPKNDVQAPDAVVDFELTNQTEQRTAEDTCVSIDELPIAVDASSVTVESGSSYANASVTIDQEQNGHYQALRGQSNNVYSSLVK